LSIYNFGIFLFCECFLNKNGDWGLGIADWGLGIGYWAQSPIIIEIQKLVNIIN
jgi:hypothetical protein